VPAFTGLGAPHWDAEARGAMFGLTRNTGPREFARAALEASATRRATCSTRCTRTGRRRQGETVLRVDGGMVASDWTMQRLADMLDAPVDRPTGAGDHGARRRLAYMTPRILGLPSRRALIRPRLTNEKRLAPLGDRLTVGPQTLTLVV
jgi:glycerol kinase